MRRIFDDSLPFIDEHSPKVLHELTPLLQSDPVCYSVAISCPEYLYVVSPALDQFAYALRTYLNLQGWAEDEIEEETHKAILSVIVGACTTAGPVELPLNVDEFTIRPSTPFIEQFKINEIARYSFDGAKVVENVLLIAHVWDRNYVQDTWAGEAFLRVIFDDGSQFDSAPLDLADLSYNLNLEPSF